MTVAEIERELLEMYADPALASKPALLEQRGGAFYSEAATRLVASLATGDGAIHVVDMRNAATLAGLAEDDVVEVPARVGEQGPLPLPQRPLAPELLGLVPHVAAYERLAVEAAVTRQSQRRAARAARASAGRAMGHGRAAPRGTARCDRRGATVTPPIVLAVDGGNSKTDLALVRADGALLAMARGPLSSPHHIGLDGCLRVLEDLLAEAMAAAGLPAEQPVAEVGHVLLAGADLPVEERALQEAISARDWAVRTTVSNDTFAILRAGTERGWGVAVVCGAGINCVGVAPDGRHVRFPALGTITGDWGGGHDVGLAAVSAAARSEDGRGPKTTLEALVPAHFGLSAPRELAEAMHLGRIPARRVLELAPVVLRRGRERCRGRRDRRSPGGRGRRARPRGGDAALAGG